LKKTNFFSSDVCVCVCIETTDIMNTAMALVHVGLVKPVASQQRSGQQ
jgi:hypothetical protein